MTKVLFFDIVRQSRRAAGISSVDANNCFDRVAHAVSSLIFQAFGVSEETCGANRRCSFSSAQLSVTPSWRQEFRLRLRHRACVRAMVRHQRVEPW